MIPRRDIKTYPGLMNYIFKRFVSPTDRTDYSLKFKNSLEKIFGGKIFLLARGRFAFDLIFDSIDPNKNDEIIIPNYYLKELIPIFENKGLKVKYCDINLKDYNYNIEELLSEINKHTKYVIISHIFGICGDILKIITKIKKKNRNIIIIEDCAHSFGSEYDGKKLGTFGDLSLLSFDYIKPLNLLGGGALLVNNKEYLKKINETYLKLNKPKKLNTVRKIWYYYFQMIILHSPLFLLLKMALRRDVTKSRIKKIHKADPNVFEKLSDFQSFLGYYQLQNLNKKNYKLETLRKKYSNLLKDISHIKIIDIGFCSKYSHYSFFIISEKDSSIIENSMYESGIDVGIKDEVMDLCSNDKNLYPNSIMLYNRIAQLPFYYRLNDKKLSKISNALKKTAIK